MPLRKVHRKPLILFEPTKKKLFLLEDLLLLGGPLLGQSAMFCTVSNVNLMNNLEKLYNFILIQQEMVH